MRHALSINLKSDAPIKQIEDLFNQTNLFRHTKLNYLSSNAELYLHIVKYDTGIYLNSPNLLPAQHYFVFSFVKLIASLFGQKHLNLLDGKEYPYYNDNTDAILIVDNEDYVLNKDSYYLYHIKNNKIIPHDAICNRSVCHPFETLKSIDFVPYRKEAKIANPYQHIISKKIFEFMTKDENKLLIAAELELQRIEIELRKYLT